MLPDNTCTFHFSSKGEKTGKTFEGSFTVKCLLTIGEQVQSAIIAERLADGATALPSAYILFNRSMADLEVRIVKDEKGNQMAPSWWRDANGGQTLYDANIVLEVFARSVDEGQKAFTARLAKEVEKSEKNKKKD